MTVWLTTKPSFTIPKMILSKGPLAQSLEVTAGQPIILNEGIHTDLIHINGKPATKVRDGKYFFGVGLPHHNKYYVLVAQKKISAGHAFRHPELAWYLSELRIPYEPSKQRVKIRLPATVQKKLKDAPDEVRRAQSLKMSQTMTQVTEKLTTECFQKPMKSNVVSKYASPRTLPSGGEYYHAGLDLRAVTGTPVYASASGTVALAEEMIFPGRVVVIDHGQGLFSRYMHLDKWQVKVGDKVTKGQQIGLSGATGRVEAPHLHWEIVWKGTALSPLDFLATWEQICDPA